MPTVAHPYSLVSFLRRAVKDSVSSASVAPGPLVLRRVENRNPRLKTPCSMLGDPNRLLRDADSTPSQDAVLHFKSWLGSLALVCETKSFLQAPFHAAC